MPSLDFVGKEFVWNHHLSVPYRPVEPQKVFGSGVENLEGNLVVHGDNLHALKALLPRLGGKVDVIYIDPPYNTGKESWKYNDNVNSPVAKEWLESSAINKDDTLRHDKWLALMFPRLKLLRELLSESGVLFVSIDDNELYHLRLVLDEIFGEQNWVGTIVWRNVTDNNPTNIAIEHEYVLCFAKNKALIEPVWKSQYSASKEALIAIGSELIESHHGDTQGLQAAYSTWFRENRRFLGPLDRYKYIDEGGVYVGSQSVHNPGREGYRYDIPHPTTGKPCRQPLMGYRFPKATMDQLIAQGKVLFGEDEDKIVELKVYASEYEDKLPSVITLDGRLGTNELKELFPDRTNPFDHPKPTALIEQLISAVAKPDAVVLDSFAGSGTTANAVFKLNSIDGGARRFVLIESEDYAEDLTAERIRRLIEGIPGSQVPPSSAGESFTFCTLGDPVDLDAMLAGDSLPSFETLGSWLFHTATGLAATPSHFDAASGHLGVVEGFHIWLRYEPSLDYLRSPDSALRMSFAEEIREKFPMDRHLVFATSKFVPNRVLAGLSIEFASLPFALYQMVRA